MPLLGWLCVVGVTVAAVLFGQTARTQAAGTAGRLPTRVRTGVVVSITGPLLVAVAGLVVAAGTGAWTAAAAGTVAAVILTVVLGLLLIP